MAKKKSKDAGASDEDGDDKKKGDDAPADPNAPGLPGYIGVGLLASLVVGWPPLRDAVLGYGPLDAAMTRFVICLLACVAGASLIGRMLDNAPVFDPAEDGSSAGSLGADADNSSSGQGDGAHSETAHDDATGDDVAPSGAPGGADGQENPAPASTRTS
jgi:hypothetical protein